MRLRLSALSFVLAFLSAVAFAQAPTPDQGSLVVKDGWVFVLDKGVLYKFEAVSMRLMARVRLADIELAAKLKGARRARVEELVEEELVVEEIIEEVEIVEEAVLEDVTEQPPLRITAPLAVKSALKWLVSHQDEDGRWDADQFMKHDANGFLCDGPGGAIYDVGVTGLATLALLGDGNTLRSGPHRDALKRAVHWLRSQQQDNGLFGTNASHDFIYSHAIATYAMSEAYGLSNFKLLKPVAQNGINYLESHRNPYSVWRYQPRDNDNDTSVTTWACLAYCSGKFFKLEVNENALKMIGSWYDQVTDPTGKVGYTKRGEASSRKPGDHSTRFPPQKGEAMTAAALVGRFMLGQTPAKLPVMKNSADLILGKPPRWDEKAGTIDPYYWYYATLAMYQTGGRHWKEWQKHLTEVANAQRKDGNFAGSWDPVGVWDCDGGRVYATALHALTLQVSSRSAQLVR